MSIASSSSLSICFMPQLLPDELLYSYIGRVSNLNILGSARRCLQQLFGSCNVIPSPDLPTRLQELQQRLGSSSPLASAIEMIEFGTLYPYHRPFLTPERGETATNLLLHGNGKGLKALIGRLANRFGANPNLRFCAECVQQDLKNHGTPYWHRSHQLPGVTVCPEHETILISQELSGVIDHKQRFILPSYHNLSRSYQKEPPPQQVSFSILSQALLEARLPAHDPLMRKKAYESAINSLGLCKRGRIHYPSLSMALRRHYSEFDGFFHKSRILSTERTPLAWLRPTLERSNRSCHPICHLILIGYLFGSLSNFLKSVEANSKLGHEPEENEQIFSQEFSSEEQAFYRDNSLSCRQVARILGVSVTSVVSRRRSLGVKISARQKYLDDDWLTRIANLLQDGLPITEVASICDVSLSTVYRIMAERPEVATACLSARLKKEKEERRRQWELAAEASHDVGVKAARTAAPAAYAWLRRNDREWLELSCQGFRTERRSYFRVDWGARDLELSERLKQFASTLRLQPSRPRLSRTLLVRQIGEALFRANEQRLPTVKSCLDVLEEPPFSYELHRLDIAIDRLREAGEKLMIWRVQRVAGIKNWTATHTIYTKWKIKKIDRLVYIN
ncbi:TnsD family Tn7-like transposition protein [Massilia consociata]